MLSRNNHGISASQARDLVGCYFDAWNEYDAPGIVSFFTRNGIYVDVPISEQHSGPQLLNYLYGYFDEGEKSHYDVDGEVLVGAGSVAFKYQAHDLNDAQAEPWTGLEFWALDGTKVARVDDYYEAPARRRPSEGAAARNTKYRKSGLTPVTANRYRTRVLALVDEERVYRQPDLSLPELARRVRCSVNHLSQVINAEFGMSFFELMNHRRIADASHMLTDDLDCPVLEIAMKAGFNSSSAFYSAFKKVHDLTPSAFRRQTGQRNRRPSPGL